MMIFTDNDNDVLDDDDDDDTDNYHIYPIYPTPPLGPDMTQGQFLSGV